MHSSCACRYLHSIDTELIWLQQQINEHASKAEQIGLTPLILKNNPKFFVWKVETEYIDSPSQELLCSSRSLLIYQNPLAATSVLMSDSFADWCVEFKMDLINWVFVQEVLICSGRLPRLALVNRRLSLRARVCLQRGHRMTYLTPLCCRTFTSVHGFLHRQAAWSQTFSEIIKMVKKIP